MRQRRRIYYSAAQHRTPAEKFAACCRDQLISPRKAAFDDREPLENERPEGPSVSVVGLRLRAARRTAAPARAVSYAGLAVPSIRGAACRSRRISSGYIPMKHADHHIFRAQGKAIELLADLSSLD